MVSVPEANSIILSHLLKPEKEKVTLVESTGRILAEPILADRDFPPFNRVTMDGIAIAFREFEKGTRSFKVTGVQAAGEPIKRISSQADCLEVMTGAMVPDGTDAVVRYEDIEIKNGIASIQINTISRWENTHSKGIDARQNEILLSPGMRISSAEVALMASVGKSMVDVFAFPRTAIVSTGDELVPILDTPLPHQIRQSNAYALQSALHEMHVRSSLFWLRDDRDDLEKNLREILSRHELIILSGGVSKGKFDFVPAVLEILGIKKHFHQVSQRPGKPFWFGSSDNNIVFALPGSPVSTYMCFYRFIKPWLITSLGNKPLAQSAVLAEAFSFKPSLTYFLQVRTRWENGKHMAYPDPGGGSGDFANLKNVDGFLELPAEQNDFAPGQVFTYTPFRS